jgi:hypothetical protein
MFGVPSTTGTGPTYTHTYSPGNTQPSLVLERKFSDGDSFTKYAKYNGCKVSQFSMSVGGDGELVADLSIAGADETIGDSAYDGDASSVSLDRLENFQAAITEGGANLAIATALDLTIDFGLDTSQYVIGGSGILGDIPEGIVNVSGTLTTLFQNMTLLNKAINSTESSLAVSFTDGSHSLTFTFNEVQYSRQTPGIEGPQGILIQLPFIAYYDDHGDATSVQAVLVNGQEGSVYGVT